MIRKIDQHIACNKRLVENTKASTQKASIKDLKVRKSKAWNQLAASQPIAEALLKGSKD